MNSYYDIAYLNYLSAKATLESGKAIGIYNDCVSLAAQAVEKFFKAVIEYYFSEDMACVSLMKSHNSKSLYRKIITKFDNCPVSARDIGWVSDFYYEVRYPGDDYIYVTDVKEAEECIMLVEQIMEWVRKLPKREDNSNTLKRLSDFD